MKKCFNAGLKLAVLALVFLVTAGRADAADKSVAEIRIVGVSTEYYCGSVEFDAGQSLQEVFLALDAAESGLTLTGTDTAYITAVNGETAGTFGGWDGWLVRINDVEAAVGIGDCILASGDSVVLYYGDPYGVGMQYPEYSFNDGVITVTSKDTVYDPVTYVPSTSVNPVVGADVTLKSGDQQWTFVTDASGKIDVSSLTNASYNISITKINDAGIPLVLVLPNTAQVQVDNALLPQTGDNSFDFMILAVLMTVVGTVTLTIQKRRG